MANRIRLADVALRAGVSTATVSRVLNGKSSVAASTRQTVLDALDAVGFDRPDRAKERPQLVGVVAPELTNPIAPHFVQELESQLSAAGCAPVLSTHAIGKDDVYLRLLLDTGVSGIIFLAGRSAGPGFNSDRQLIDVPYVTINGWNPTIGVPDFSSDDVEAIKDSVRHLHHAGHRHIGLMTGPERFRNVQDMAIGYRQAMLELCPDVDQHVIHSLFSIEGGQLAADQLLDHDITGIICGSDVMALGAIRQIRQRGLAVPEDVSIIGYDDSPLMAFTDPPLTSNRQPVRQIVSGAVETLIELMSGSNPPRVPVSYRTELITRGSSGSAPKR